MSRVMVVVLCGECSGRREPVAEVIDAPGEELVRMIDKPKRRAFGWQLGQPPNEMSFQSFEEVDSHAPLAVVLGMDPADGLGYAVARCSEHGDIVLFDLADELRDKVAKYRRRGRRQYAVGNPRSAD